MNKTIFFALLLLMIGDSFSLQSQNITFADETFDLWINTRVGNGESPAYWYCYGEVYSYPDGEHICNMVGADMGIKRTMTQDSILQLSRKIFIYTDIETGEALEEYKGNPVKHIQYPYQLISYVRDGEDMRTWVTQGSGARMQTIGPGTDMTARKLGDSYVFSAPLFLNFETPRGKYEAYENYDFIYNPSARKTKDRYQIIWNRYGDRPAFAGAGKGVIQLVANRVDKWEELPDALKKYINEKAPMWKSPPQNLEEITKLQQGK